MLQTPQPRLFLEPFSCSSHTPWGGQELDVDPGSNLRTHHVDSSPLPSVHVCVSASVENNTSV